MVAGKAFRVAKAEGHIKHNWVASERASEPRERSAPGQRRARERVGESEGRSPSGDMSSAIESRVMNRFAALAACVLVALPALTAAQSARSFRGRLSPVPIPAALPTVTGVGVVTATLSGTTLTIAGTFEGLASPATVAKLHRAPKGIRGPAVFDLTITPATSGKISGSLDLTPAQVEDLGRERFYVQLHSEKAPDGNLWGWLLVQETKR